MNDWAGGASASVQTSKLAHSEITIFNEPVYKPWGTLFNDSRIGLGSTIFFLKDDQNYDFVFMCFSSDVKLMTLVKGGIAFSTPFMSFVLEGRNLAKQFPALINLKANWKLDFIQVFDSKRHQPITNDNEPVITRIIFDMPTAIFDNLKPNEK